MKLPGQEEGLEVSGVEGSSVWGMKVPLEQRALKNKTNKKKKQKNNVKLQNESSDGYLEELYRGDLLST